MAGAGGQCRGPQAWRLPPRTSHAQLIQVRDRQGNPIASPLYAPKSWIWTFGSPQGFTSRKALSHPTLGILGPNCTPRFGPWPLRARSPSQEEGLLLPDPQSRPSTRPMATCTCPQPLAHGPSSHFLRDQLLPGLQILQIRIPRHFSSVANFRFLC